MYFFYCDTCSTKKRRFLTPAEAREPQPCYRPGKDSHSICYGALLRIPRPPTTNVVERLDNGLMPRAVERPADAERLYHERAHADDPTDD